MFLDTNLVLYHFVYSKTKKHLFFKVERKQNLSQSWLQIDRK